MRHAEIGQEVRYLPAEVVVRDRTLWSGNLTSDNERGNNRGGYVRHSRHRRPRLRGLAYMRARFAQPAAAGLPASPARRAMRLMLALGAAAVALGTVLGMVAIVVTLGNGEIASPLSSAGVGGVIAGVATSTSPHQRPSAVSGITTIASYHGTHARRISIPVTGKWGISWSFTCPAGTRGNFALEDTTSTAPDKLSVRVSGKASSHGSWWGTSKPGRHSLLVTSTCPWSASLLAPVGAKSHHTSGPTPTQAPTRTPSSSPSPAPTSSSPSPSPTPTSSSPSPSPSPRHSPNPHHTHTPPPKQSPAP